MLKTTKEQLTTLDRGLLLWDPTTCGNLNTLNSVTVKEVLKRTTLSIEITSLDLTKAMKTEKLLHPTMLLNIVMVTMIELLHSEKCLQTMTNMKSSKCNKALNRSWILQTKTKTKIAWDHLLNNNNLDSACMNNTDNNVKLEKTKNINVCNLSIKETTSSTVLPRPWEIESLPLIDLKLNHTSLMIEISTVLDNRLLIFKEEEKLLKSVLLLSKVIMKLNFKVKEMLSKV